MVWAALVATATVGALLFAGLSGWEAPGGGGAVPRGFVARRGARFVVDERPFRFTGANIALTYGDDERARMPAALRAAATRDRFAVIRVWAFGEVEEQAEATAAGGGSGGGDEWLRANPFRRGPGGWNEAAFVHLDQTIAEAARNNQRVQICLTNWWPDTGGVTRYLRWAGVSDAYDQTHPYGVNVERAMQFYTNELARQFYREHVARIVLRRNTVTGMLYRDDPTIMAYELMNEAQAPTGRWAERRAWVAEMSAYIKSLDPHHLVTPGTWGYRNALERRQWLEEHALPTVDYCDVHLYPHDDLDLHIDSIDALRAFIDNRAAAAFSLNKPLVIGEFGMLAEGFRGLSQAEWFRAYFESAADAGVSGAMCWILTHDPGRSYGILYDGPRDELVRAEFARAAELFAARADEGPPPRLLKSDEHLVPRQVAFARTAAAEGSAAAPPVATRPTLDVPQTGMLRYRFQPGQAARGSFEKLGDGPGYLWGAGVGFFEYIVPAREERQWVDEIIVRAYLQPTPPHDAQKGRVTATRVTLYINGTNCGAQLVLFAPPPAAPLQEWRVDSLRVRAGAALGSQLAVRFEVEVDADQPFGLTISNFPEGYDPRGTAPVEVEIIR